MNHAALACLNQWFRTDRHHMLGRNDRLTGEALRKIAAKYMVSRTISMKDTKGIAVPEQERERRWDHAARLVAKAKVLFQRRHLLAHSDGVIDQKCLTKVGMPRTKSDNALW